MKMSGKILLRVGLALVVIVAALAGVVAMQPSDFRVERSTMIAAPPAAVFAQVNDFHHWQQWSPWANLDPDAEAIFEGPSSGEGAIFRWSGNHEVGQGSMTILESRPHELIRIRLEFIKPHEDTATAEFTFQEVGEQTKVTWSMYGEQKFIGKAVCLLLNMQEMVGGQFDQGLAAIKARVETSAP